MEEQVQQLKTSRYSENTSRPEKVCKRRTEEPEKYSKSHQFQLKRQRKNDCVESLKWMEQEGYTPLQIEIKNNRTGKLETFVLQEEDLEAMFGPDAGSATDSDLDLISMMLYVKDKYDVSGNAYHKMSRLCKGLPRSYKIKQRISEHNKSWNIFSHPKRHVWGNNPLKNSYV